MHMGVHKGYSNLSAISNQRNMGGKRERGYSTLQICSYG